MTAITDATLTPDDVDPEHKLPENNLDLPPVVPVHDQMATSRLAGYGWDDIHDHLENATDQAMAAGYQPHEIDEHLGIQGTAALSDTLGFEAQTALADATREGADMPALEAASRGTIPAPQEGKEPTASVDPATAQSYARALMNGDVMSADEFAKVRTQAIYDAAVEPGTDPFGVVSAHIDGAAKSLAAQLPRPEDVTDHAIALVHAAGHDPSPGLIAIAKEQILDRWADTGKSPQQTLQEAQNDPSLADTLTRPRVFAVPPSLDDLELPKRDAVVDPFDAVGKNLSDVGRSLFGIDETIKAQTEYDKQLAELMKPGDDGTPGLNLLQASARLGLSPAANFAGMGSLGPEGGAGVSARFASPKLLTALKEASMAGDTAATTAAMEAVAASHADELAKYTVIQETLGELPRNPRNSAEAQIRFTRGQADQELAIAKDRLDQWTKPVQDALPEHLETIKQVQAAGSFTSYVKEGGKLDDLTIMKLYAENRTRLNLENPFPEEHPLFGLADTLRDIHQGIRDRLEQNPLFDGMGFHEDYYRHLWQDPDAADRVFGAGREGSAASTRKRDIPTEMQGIERGLTPKIPDPIANTLQYMHGLLYHEATLNTLAMGRTAEQIKWSPSEYSAPEEGWERLQGKTANTARKWNRDVAPDNEGRGPAWGGEGYPRLEDHRLKMGGPAEEGKITERQPLGTDRQLGNETVAPFAEEKGGPLATQGQGEARRYYDPKLIEWQAEHVPEAVKWETPSTEDAIANTEAQRRGNAKRIDELKSLVKLHEVQGWDAAHLTTELEQRRLHDIRLGSKLYQLEQRMKAERDLAPKTGNPNQIEGPPKFKQIEHKSFSLDEEPSDVPAVVREGGKPAGGTEVGFPEGGGEVRRSTGKDVTKAKPEAGAGPAHQTETTGTSKTRPEYHPEAATRLVSYAWAPKGYARVYNSWVGRGFHDHAWLGPIYNGLQYASNMMNGFKLSLSGFHLANIAQETGVAGIARAYGELAHGDLKNGLANLGMGAAILPEMAHMVIKGKALGDAYLNRTGGKPVDPELVSLFAQAGGRVGGRAGVYRIDGRDNLISAFRSGKLKNELKQDFSGWHAVLAPAEYLARLTDSINAPLFDHVIPNIKQGAWSTEMADFLRQNPLADKATKLSRARKIMDSIDDRFGEMNQDNLFWNRYAKQVLNLATVSIGWEYGTLRAFGHAGLDIATGNWNSTRARWLPAFLSMTALQNGMSQYLHGQGLPNNATNWLIGGKTGGPGNETGAWPSYGKEIINGVQMAMRTQDFMGGLQQIGGYLTGKENTFWQAVKMAYTGLDWDDKSLRIKWEAAHHAPPNFFQSAYQILAKSTVPIVAQQILGIGGEAGQGRKAGTQISKFEQWLGERALGQQITDPEKWKATQKYFHDRDLKAEATRELKANAKLENPDQDLARNLQETIDDMKNELRADRLANGGNGGTGRGVGGTPRATGGYVGSGGGGSATGGYTGHTQVGNHTYYDRTGASESFSGGATVFRGPSAGGRQTVSNAIQDSFGNTEPDNGIVANGSVLGQNPYGARTAPRSGGGSIGRAGGRALSTGARRAIAIRYRGRR